MGTTLSGRLNLKLDWVYQDISDPIWPAKDNNYLKEVIAFANGNSANQATGMYRDRRTLTAATGTDQLDLAGGITDKFGNTLTFAQINVLIIRNLGLAASGNDGSSSDSWTEAAGQDLLVFGAGAGANGWEGPLNDQDATLRVRSGGILPLFAPVDGYRVIAGSRDTLQILWAGSAASGGDIEYDIIVLGR